MLNQQLVERMMVWLAVPRTIIYAPRRSGKTFAIKEVFSSDPHRFKMITLDRTIRNRNIRDGILNRLQGNRDLLERRIRPIAEYFSVNPEDFLLFDEFAFLSTNSQYLANLWRVVPTFDFSGITTPTNASTSTQSIMNLFENQADNIVRLIPRLDNSSFIEEHLKGCISGPKFRRFRKHELPEELFTL